MKLDRLVHMANQIGQFFAAGADQEIAAKEIAVHLKKFWDPRMRLILLQSLDDPNNSEVKALLPLVRKAMTEHRTFICPPVGLPPANLKDTTERRNQRSDP